MNAFGRSHPKGLAVIGYGLLGRLVVLELVHAGAVQPNQPLRILDQDGQSAIQSVGRLGAGLLGIWSESAHFDSKHLSMAKASVGLWMQHLRLLGIENALHRSGCLVAAHRQQQGAFDLFQQQLKEPVQLQTLSKQAIAELEPCLKAYNGTLGWIEGEAWLQVDQLYQAIDVYLDQHPYVSIHKQRVESKDFPILKDQYDYLFDCRGLGVKEDFQYLRGVRGDIVTLWAPEVTLSRPVRVLHPQHAIYLVPRPNQRFLVGATQIESEDLEPIRARTLMELLATAYSLHPGFGEARVEAVKQGLRPTTVSGFPEIKQEANRVAATGLYRHGYLLGPSVAKTMVSTFTQYAALRRSFRATHKNPM